MLEQETWVFGEQFALGTSDETLNDVLKYHQNLLGHGNDEVQLEEDKRMVKIPDLVFGQFSQIECIYFLPVTHRQKLSEDFVAFGS